jgi:ubiquinone biosynthesis protein UbiJ
MQQEIDTLKQLVERLSARVIRLEQEIGIDPTTNT